MSQTYGGEQSHLAVAMKSVLMPPHRCVLHITMHHPSNHC